MKKAVLIVGLPASGKTTFVESNFKDGWLIIDDPVEYERDVVNKINATGADKLVVSDPYFCMDGVISHATAKLKALGFDVECIYFENNVSKCLRNMEYRNANSGTQRKVANFIKDASKSYVIPENVVPLIIWDGLVS